MKCPGTKCDSDMDIYINSNNETEKIYRCKKCNSYWIDNFWTIVVPPKERG